ncbi:class I SAM-dependent methyltransferase [Limibacillus sp. MBR-115]|uniref:class I SAM-dependent methyltransferase n=1 Tax=Limibacillus sp. MBR-115 TaxID=3156465 RepID=UPI003395EBC1
MTDRPRSRHTEVLKQFVQPEGKHVADVGCGDGGLVRYLARKGAKAVGIDPQPGQLERARAVPPAGGEQYLQAGAQALPFEDGSLDAVIFFNSLHHLPLELMDTGLMEACRCLKSGGTLYVLEPLAEGPWFTFMRPVDDETFVRAKAEEALRRAAALPGFKQTARKEYASANDYRSFADLKVDILSIDPARQDAFQRHETQLRAAFDTAADEILEDGTHRFWSPYRATVFQKAA